MKSNKIFIFPLSSTFYLLELLASFEEDWERRKMKGECGFLGDSGKLSVNLPSLKTLH